MTVSIWINYTKATTKYSPFSGQPLIALRPCRHCHLPWLGNTRGTLETRNWGDDWLPQTRVPTATWAGNVEGSRLISERGWWFQNDPDKDLRSITSCKTPDKTEFVKKDCTEMPQISSITRIACLPSVSELLSLKDLSLDFSADTVFLKSLPVTCI